MLRLLYDEQCRTRGRGPTLPKAQPLADRSDLDEIDRQILRALAADGRLTNKAIAARVGIAESTCAYRMRALRAAGIITGTKVQLALGALGYPIQAVVKIRLASHSREHVNRLYADLTQVPGVLQALHVAVESAQALRDLVLEHVTVHRVVRQTQTQLVFEARDGVGILPALE